MALVLAHLQDLVVLQLKDCVTPQGKLRKKLSFEVKNNEVFDIQAENKAPCPEKKRLAVAKTPAMSINEADEILKTMHTDLA